MPLYCQSFNLDVRQSIDGKIRMINFSNYYLLHFTVGSSIVSIILTSTYFLCHKVRYELSVHAYCALAYIRWNCSKLQGNGT